MVVKNIYCSPHGFCLPLRSGRRGLGQQYAQRARVTGLSFPRAKAANDAQAAFNRYGGWKDGPQLEATGFFRTPKKDGKWWLVDPLGHLFFSHGANSVGLPSKRRSTAATGSSPATIKSYSRTTNYIVCNEGCTLFTLIGYSIRVRAGRQGVTRPSDRRRHDDETKYIDGVRIDLKTTRQGLSQQP